MWWNGVQLEPHLVGILVFSVRLTYLLHRPCELASLDLPSLVTGPLPQAEPEGVGGALALGRDVRASEGTPTPWADAEVRVMVFHQEPRPDEGDET